MDAGDLRVFEAVARLGGMNRAAAELNTVQSNVTARIRLLEDELGAPLFQRHSRGVTLTASGRRLLPYAVRVEQLLDDARRAAADEGTPKGRLAIGSLETTAALRLSPVLAAYVASYPAVDLVLGTGTTAELIDQVLQHRIDGAFVCGPVRHKELVEERVFREELVLATAPSVRGLDALVEHGDLKIVVLRVGCSYRQRLETILAGRGVIGLRRLEFGTLDAIFGCVAAGLGITLMPRGVVDASRFRGEMRVHDLPASDAVVDTMFIRHRDGFAPSALAAFLDHVRPAMSEAAE